MLGPKTSLWTLRSLICGVKPTRDIAIALWEGKVPFPFFYSMGWPVQARNHHEVEQIQHHIQEDLSHIAIVGQERRRWKSALTCAIADLWGVMSSLPCATLWLVTCVTRKWPHTTPVNAESDCHVPPILQRHLLYCHVEERERVCPT